MLFVASWRSLMVCGVRTVQNPKLDSFSTVEGHEDTRCSCICSR